MTNDIWPDNLDDMLQEPNNSAISKYKKNINIKRQIVIFISEINVTYYYLKRGERWNVFNSPEGHL